MVISRSSWPHWARLLPLVAAVAMIGWLDYRTGPLIGFSLFYLVPVVTAASLLGRGATAVAAVAAATAWFTADHLAASSSLGISIWNTTTRLVIFLAVGGLVARLREEKRRLETANVELDAFSRSVSHDLRSPLIRIGRYAEMFERGSSRLDEEGRRYLTIISQTANEGLSLVDDLLEFAQVARTDLRRSPVDLAELVPKLRSELLEGEEGRQIRWSIGPLPTVRGDRAMLEVLMKNLLANAVKFTRPRNEAVIEVGSFVSNEGPVVYVRDNGVGFNPDYAQKLFAVFERLHGQQEFEGTGIGLALVDRIASRHGGRVWAEGAVDRGATFFVQLPVKR